MSDVSPTNNYGSRFDDLGLALLYAETNLSFGNQVEMQELLIRGLGHKRLSIHVRLSHLNTWRNAFQEG